jgi:transcriptional regulator with XRE-family HTH domain
MSVEHLPGAGHPARRTRSPKDEDSVDLRAAFEEDGALFRSHVDATIRRQRLFNELVDRRKRLTSQQRVAKAMRTSQPAVARFEKGGADPLMSTVERYATAVGARIVWYVRPEPDALLALQLERQEPGLSTSRVKSVTDTFRLKENARSLGPAVEFFQGLPESAHLSGIDKPRLAALLS